MKYIQSLKIFEDNSQDPHGLVMDALSNISDDYSVSVEFSNPDAIFIEIDYSSEMKKSNPKKKLNTDYHFQSLLIEFLSRIEDYISTYNIEYRKDIAYSKKSDESKVDIKIFFINLNSIGITFSKNVIYVDGQVLKSNYPCHISTTTGKNDLNLYTRINDKVPNEELIINYLKKEGVIFTHKFSVDERIIVPSTGLSRSADCYLLIDFSKKYLIKIFNQYK